MKRDLLVGVAQWLSTPGDAALNLSVALGHGRGRGHPGCRAARAARAVVLRLRPRDAARGRAPGAEARDGPRAARLADAARRHDLFLVAGSVPEVGTGRLYDTVLAFNQRGDLAAWHRKTHLYPPTLEHSVFAAGERLTTFDDPMLGRVGLVAGFEGDVPEVARCAGACAGPASCWRRRPPRSSALPAWDLLQPAWALANSQWWVQANQAGSHAALDPARGEPDHRPDRHRGCRRQLGRPRPARPAELLVHRIDLHLAHRREGVGRPARGRAPAPTSTPSWSSGCRQWRAERRGRRVAGGARPLVGSPPCAAHRNDESRSTRGCSRHAPSGATPTRRSPTRRCATSSSPPRELRAARTASRSASSS